MELRFLIRFASLTYVGVLSVLLLSPLDGIAPPSLHWPGSFIALLVPGVHFFAILLLGLLMFASRWPLPLWSAIALVAVYAVGTEGLQSFIPSRTPELRDLVQNLAGLGAATAVWLAYLAIARSSVFRSRSDFGLPRAEASRPIASEPRSYDWVTEHEPTEETCPTG